MKHFEKPEAEGNFAIVTEPTPWRKFTAGRALVSEVSGPFFMASMIGVFLVSMISFYYEVSNIMAVSVFLLISALLTITLAPKGEPSED